MLISYAVLIHVALTVMDRTGDPQLDKITYVSRFRIIPQAELKQIYGNLENFIFNISPSRHSTRSYELKAIVAEFSDVSEEAVIIIDDIQKQELTMEFKRQAQKEEGKARVYLASWDDSQTEL